MGSEIKNHLEATSLIRMETKRSPTRLLDWATLALLFVCVLTPIWIVRYPPIQDYWNHLLNARILADYSDPALHYSRYYRLSHLPIPNSASTLVMALFMKAVSPGIAGKLFLSLYALALPISARYIVRCSQCRIKSLEYIGFAVVYNPCFWAGFIDFCLSAAIAQFAIGYWIRTRNEVSPSLAAKYILLVLLTYFAHLWGVVVLTGAVFVMSLWESRARKLLWLGSTALIGVLFLIYSSGAHERGAMDYRGLTFTLSILRNTLALPSLLGSANNTFQTAASGVLIALRLTLMAWLVVLALRRRTPLLYAGCSLMALYFVLPSQFGRMYEPGQRTLIFLPALLAAAVSVRPGARQTAILSALVLAAGILPAIMSGYVWVGKDKDLRVLHRALSRIPAQRNVLYVIMTRQPRLTGTARLLGSDVFQPEAFFGADYNIERGGYYVHTFTTGIVKVRANPTAVAPMFIMDGRFTWSRWLKSNLELVKDRFDYIVIVRPSPSVSRLLARYYAVCHREGQLELMRNRSTHKQTKLCL